MATRSRSHRRSHASSRSQVMSIHTFSSYTHCTATMPIAGATCTATRPLTHSNRRTGHNPFIMVTPSFSSAFVLSAATINRLAALKYPSGRDSWHEIRSENILILPSSFPIRQVYAEAISLSGALIVDRSEPLSHPVISPRYRMWRFWKILAFDSVY
ncbi:hypothetical protein BO94DRAFT_314354 [Aspergillus sclerotioniger CBS 115572]|uniref:Uncharacterized protein n=1 Tax=Aspergillus sclerotioniger CBS 115572 TaxID=1450535 RepID=A0A317X8E3_9EURO|nr:hypothetical protein BO94DRAFT_314354 [Aspergillus sclerotioniger CBS 115572]PWY93932.1 hypothetical protein BO94DRAFT_314354 [Aspergillus sclerotioniger CBS 115572]